MTQVSKTTAKSYFNTGDTPSEAEFANFIDSAKWYDESAGSGLNFSFSSTAPADTTVAWIDSGSLSHQAYPIRYYINGAWTPATEEGDWWCTIGNVISRGKPIGILFSGQSNVTAPGYYPQDAPSYTGDVTQDKHVTYWNNAVTAFQVVVPGSAAYPFTWNITESSSVVGTNNIFIFAKQLAAHTGRSVRLVGTRESGTALVSWESGGASWTKLKSYADASGIGFFDAFIWIHGEAELGGGSAFASYRLSFRNLVTRIRSEAWGNYKTKIIAPSHGLGHQSQVVEPTSAEGTIRELSQDGDPFTAWTPISSSRDLQVTSGVQDIYHFTTRETERLGHLLFHSWRSLPLYNKLSGNSTVWVSDTETIKVNAKRDSIKEIFSSQTNNAGQVEFRFGFPNEGSDKLIVKAQGANGKGQFEFWTSQTTAEAVSTDVALKVMPEGNFVAKPSLTQGNMHMSSGSTNNAGDCVMGFWHNGQQLPTSSIPATAIVSKAAGSFGRGNLHFIVQGSGNTANIAADTKFFILNDGRIGVGTTSPSSMLHLKAGSATANTAPLQFTSGVVETTARGGVMEYNNTFHLTNSDNTRRHVMLAPNTTKITAGAPYTNDGYVEVNIGGTTFKLMTTA